MRGHPDRRAGDGAGDGGISDDAWFASPEAVRVLFKKEKPRGVLGTFTTRSRNCGRSDTL